MSKTVKQLADDLGVSRQYVQKVISNLPATKKPTKQQHRYIIDNQDEAYIKALILKTDNKATKNSTKETNKATNSDSGHSLKYETALEDQIRLLKVQLDKKDDQLEKMQKLLDQSQQLQLMAEHKLKQLEAPEDEPESAAEPTADQIHTRAPEAPRAAENGPEQPLSFWRRLFGR
ncbi:DUF536 domain-containing protein [Lacticaseibacillus paracasei]|uniref:DUF536 domain-containing protein n=1 Tax=Lacticaseibacillus paracasei TaxID=1597 RepID=UPI0031F4D771